MDINTRRTASGSPLSLSRAVTFILIVGSLLMGGAPAWAAAARFVPEASNATWDDAAVTVTFREIGAPPNGTTSIAVEATGTIETVCRQDGAVRVSIRSSASAAEVSDYPVDGDGTVDGNRRLAVMVQRPVVSGLNCTPQETRTLTVVLRDLVTGATHVIAA